MSRPEDDPDSGSLAERLGTRIRAKRGALDLTLASLSERSGVSVSYLSAVEKGINLPSLTMLVKITDALGVSIPSMLADEGQNRVSLGALPEQHQVIEISHPDLQLKVQVLRTGPDTRGELGLDTKEHDIFVYMLDGDMHLALADQQELDLRAGDAVDMRSPELVSWRTVSGCCALWSSCPL